MVYSRVNCVLGLHGSVRLVATHYHCTGMGSIPGLGTKILHATHVGKKKKELTAVLSMNSKKMWKRKRGRKVTSKARGSLISSSIINCPIDSHLYFLSS